MIKKKKWYVLLVALVTSIAVYNVVNYSLTSISLEYLAGFGNWLLVLAIFFCLIDLTPLGMHNLDKPFSRLAAGGLALAYLTNTAIVFVGIQTSKGILMGAVISVILLATRIFLIANLVVIYTEMNKEEK